MVFTREINASRFSYWNFGSVYQTIYESYTGLIDQANFLKRCPKLKIVCLFRCIFTLLTNDSYALVSDGDNRQARLSLLNCLFLVSVGEARGGDSVYVITRCYHFILRLIIFYMHCCVTVDQSPCIISSFKSFANQLINE